MNSENSKAWANENRSFLLLSPIMLLGAFLRFYNLGGQSLWNDEIKSVKYAGNSIIEILTISFWRDTHQPLYYLILHFILPFSDGEAMVRLTSVVFGVLSIGVFYLIIKEQFGEGYNYLGAFLLAVSPFHIWYSQEARPYAMLLFLSLLSLFFLQKLLKSKTNSFRIAFIVSAAATYYCHSIALTLVLFISIYVFWSRGRQEWKYWLVTLGSIGLLISPTFLPLLVNPPSHSADPFRDLNLAQIGYMFWAFATGYAAGPSLVELHFIGPTEVLQEYGVLVLLIGGIIGALVVRGLYRLWNTEKESFLLVTLWLFVPIVFVVLAVLFSSHPIIARYVILAYPAFLIIVMMGIGRVGARKFAPLMLTVVVFISFFSLYNYYGNPKYHRENNRAAGEFLSKHAEQDDLVIVSAAYVGKNLRHYYPQGSVILGYPKGGNFVENQVLENELQEIVSDRDRFWLFLSRTYHSDPQGLIKKYFDSNFKRLKHGSWNGAELILYYHKEKKLQAKVDNHLEYSGSNDLTGF